MAPKDRKLRHLATLMDRDKMRNVLQQTIYADGSSAIRQCQIMRIKYKPAKNCQVCYRLIVENKDEKVLRKRWLYAKCFETGGAESRYRKARRGMAKNTDTGDSALHIAELDTVVWIFPNDRKLRRLDEITDNRFLEQTDLAKQIVTGFGPGWTIKSLNSQVIRYVPEHTCTFRTSIGIVQRKSRLRRDLVLYGKAYYNNTGERTYRLMRRLWGSQARRRGKLRIPKPLHYQKPFKLLWVSAVPGLMLSEMTGDAAIFFEYITKAAKQIACLHQQPIEGYPEMDGIDPFRELQRVKSSLRTLDRSYRGKADVVIERLFALMPDNHCQPNALLHGDLHLKNILCDVDDVYLIDLDNLTLGNPLQEVGSFVAATIDLGLTARIPPDWVDPTIRRFLESYRECVPWGVNNAQLRWHIAAALIYQRLFRGYTRLKPGRLKILGQLIDFAESLLESELNSNWFDQGGGMPRSNTG